MNSRLSSESALTALNSESALEVTRAVCNDFKGDICPIGKDTAFIYAVYVYAMYGISFIKAGDHELQ